MPPAPACELKESRAHALLSQNRPSCSKHPKPHNDTVQCGLRGEENSLLNILFLVPSTAPLL